MNNEDAELEEPTGDLIVSQKRIQHLLNKEKELEERNVRNQLNESTNTSGSASLEDYVEEEGEALAKFRAQWINVDNFRLAKTLLNIKNKQGRTPLHLAVIS